MLRKIDTEMVTCLHFDEVIPKMYRQEILTILFSEEVMIVPSVHEFGIIDKVNSKKDYDGEYSPEKYKCISVEDDIICRLSENLTVMKTYFHSMNRPEFGLAYFGITIIPPDSLLFFCNAVTSSGYFKESDELVLKIQQAITEKKHMIHYGI